MITLIILLCIPAVAVIVTVIGFCIGIDRYNMRTALGMDAEALGRMSEKSRYGHVAEHADDVYRAIKLGCYVAGRHGRFSYDHVLPERLCRAYTKDELEQRIAPPRDEQAREGRIRGGLPPFLLGLPPTPYDALAARRMAREG